MNSGVLAALIAAGVSIIVTVVTLRVSSKTSRSQLLQTQFAEVVKKRIELYPKLWSIHIRYETNWQLDDRPKTREWAAEYLDALNTFNLTGGLFFSQSLYTKFFALRRGCTTL